MQYALYLLYTILFLGFSKSGKAPENELPPWQPGYLDIHHLSIAGDAAFFIFPDGTTMLFDAGDSDQDSFELRAAPLKAAPIRPNNQKQAGAWYADYIKAVLQAAKLESRIDYAVISHFDTDHYGLVKKTNPLSKKGNYQLTGITEVNEHLPITTLLDRGYPNYDFPTDLRIYKKEDKTFQNYLKYVQSRADKGLYNQMLQVEQSNQIKLLKNTINYPNFSVVNTKSNGTIWAKAAPHYKPIFTAEELIASKFKITENPLSLALWINYGAFDYFTGGDMTGLSDSTVPVWFDTETPVGKEVGEIDVLALNHHGVRDATNLNFVQALSPQISIIQGRTSDHPGQEVVHRLLTVQQTHNLPILYSTYLHEETLVTYGPWFEKALGSKRGHVMIRVNPKGEYFSVFVLDDRQTGIHLLKSFGPYKSKGLR